MEPVAGRNRAGCCARVTGPTNRPETPTPRYRVDRFTDPDIVQTASQVVDASKMIRIGDGDVHHLKTVRPHFEAAWEGRKTFEIRNTWDHRREIRRDFKVGDFLILEEWDKDTGYSGRFAVAGVSLVLRQADLPQCPEAIGSDYCVMSIHVWLKA
jgi:hypothetical protein